MKFSAAFFTVSFSPRSKSVSCFLQSKFSPSKVFGCNIWVHAKAFTVCLWGGGEFTNSNSRDFPPPVKLGEDRRSDHIKRHHTSLKEKTQKSRHKWIQYKHVNHNHGNKLVLHVLYYLLYFLSNVCTSSMFSLWEHWLLVIFSSRRASLVGNVAISIYWPMLSNDQ